MKKVLVSVRLSHDLIKDIRKICDNKEWTFTQVVEKLLHKGLARKQ